MSADPIVLDGLPFDVNAPFLDFSAYVGDDPETRARLEGWRATLRGRLDLSGYDDPGRRWYQAAWVEAFVFLYDTSFYDPVANRYRIDEYLDRGQREVGGYDVLLLWQSYPRLGIDRRNQFDLYREIPGGLAALERLIARCHERGVRVFLNYNPWDTGTRREPTGDGEALGQIVSRTAADGVFLDTMQSMDSAFKGALLAANPACVFDPEGVPPTADLQNITGGWMQARDYHPPMVPTIRWLEPRFTYRAIERTTVSRGELLARSLFYGCGQVFWENVFGWWNPWGAEDLAHLKGVLRILRNHRDAFCDAAWQPFVATLAPGVYANRWRAQGKTIYTIFNTLDRRIEGPVLRIENRGGGKVYDLLAGSPGETPLADDGATISLSIPERGGACVGVLREPDPVAVRLPPRVPTSASPNGAAPNPLAGHAPRPVVPTRRAPVSKPPKGMVLIPGSRFVMRVRHNTSPLMEGACYGSREELHDVFHPDQFFWMEPFFIDRTEVTNEQYRRFLSDSHYAPADLTSFLGHFPKKAGTESRPWMWELPPGKADHPVVYVDLADARAFARWAGKRLPREEEWQYAAQGTDERLWPWGNEPGELERHNDYGTVRYYGNKPDLARCNSHSGDTTPVEAYPQGASPFGVLDMAGNVWELTEGERDDGHTRYAILKGGSFAAVTGSLWYRTSGAQPCGVHEKMLLMHPGLDRCETVGFRCVVDAE